MGMHERKGHALPTSQHPLLTKAERIVLWLFHGQLPGLLTKDSLYLQVPLREFNCSTRLRATESKILRNAAAAARCISGHGSHLLL